MVGGGKENSRDGEERKKEEDEVRKCPTNSVSQAGSITTE